ncbi:MAG: hypothetical protein QOG54_2202 [Actinomycetota bacterium]|jgi:hypothetical protein|nr:hypothetical protein [Actinomycetota bacterium]
MDAWSLPLQILAIRNGKVERFLEDPMLTIAAVLLIVVSVGYVVVTRMIVRRYRRAYIRSRRERARLAAQGIPQSSGPRIDVVRPPRDIWSLPP